MVVHREGDLDEALADHGEHEGQVPEVEGGLGQHRFAG